MVFLAFAGLAWLLIHGQRLELEEPSTDLFKRYVLNPIPDSVMQIRASRTSGVTSQRCTIRFKISRTDLGPIIDSRPFRKVEKIKYRQGILDWKWNSGSRVEVHLYPRPLREPAWFTLDKWDNPEAYAIFESEQYQRNMWVLLYNDELGEAYFLVWSGHD
jgi:hypothetical protein